jgi:hypothetical protein
MSGPSPFFESGAPLASPPAWADERFLTGRSDADWHTKHTSDISLVEYARVRRRELSKAIAHKVKIYLDQRYWIHCRDAALGTASDVYSEIWNTLLQLVRDGRAICPASSASVIETFKQGDIYKRRRTAEVMDELSTGIALRSASGRRAAEFQFLLRRLVGDDVGNERPSDQALTWLFEVFGDLAIAEDRRAVCDAEAIGKAMFDAFCRMRFPDVLRAIPGFSEQLLFGRDRASRERHNRIAESNLKKRPMSHAERLKREVHSTLEWLITQLTPALSTSIGGSEEAVQLVRNRFKGFLAARHDQGEFKRDLPTMYIGSAIFAAIDHKRRRYDDGDLFDHDHATAALPYCDFFLTEGKLGTLLTEKPAQLDKEYGCRVLWKNDQILAELRALT